MRWFTEDEYTEHHTRERDLWAAVVTQALMDATARRESYHRAHTRGWLLNDASDFPFVCQCAGLNPTSVRKYARALRDGNWARAQLPFGQNGRSPMRGAV